MSIKQIKKRDGRLVDFDITKIKNAIQKAFEEQKQTANYTKLANDAVSTISTNTPTVEEIQDAVEKVLITKNYPDVAKAYILYRNERTRVRDAKSHHIQALREITNLDAKDSDMMRENANIDADTAMGTMLKYGSESAKEYFKMEVLDPKYSKAHDDGDIHIHDLDFYTLTTTCCQIELKKLFKDGFSTGHGYLREPNSIMSYASLAAIAIQANQNDQHGGQSICDFDYAMADGVRKSFKKAFAKNLAKGFNVLYGEDYMSEEQAKEITNDINPVYSNTDNLDKYIEKGQEKGCKMSWACQFDSDWDNVPYFAHVEAKKDVERETYQAMEAFIHNLNTMHCLPASEKIWIKHNNKVSLKTMKWINKHVNKGETVEVLSLSDEDHTTKWAKVTASKRKNKNRRLITIHTKAGQKVTSTDNHEILTLDCYGNQYTTTPENLKQTLSPKIVTHPQQTNDINIEKFAKTKSDSPYFETHLVKTTNLAELLGIYAGDGSVTSGSTLALSVANKIDEKYLSDLVNHALGAEIAYSIRKHPNDIPDYRFNVGTRVCRAFEAMAGKGAINKHVPTWIMCGNSEFQKAFLKGYAKTDGRQTQPYQEMVSISEELIKGVGLLMMQLGEMPYFAEYTKNNRIFYKVSLGHQACNHIDIPVVNKPTAFELTNYDLSLLSENLTYSDTKDYIKRRHSKEIRKEELEHYLCNNPDKKQELDIFLKTLSTKVVSYDVSNSEDEYVYDISVDKYENFLTADGIFVHNSRAGAQTPFSSINYGMDTSEEGRLVIKQLLKATEAGLGNGETPIFPVQIFKVKEGVNYNPGDPNYDLFCLAMHCSAKRLFPNFSFLDAPFNAQYYKGTPETEIAYMGCVEGSETVAVRYTNSQMRTTDAILPFKRLWRIYSDANNNISVNHTEYIEKPYGLKVWDSHTNGYVKVKTLIKNPNRNNWYDITFNNGRHLLATTDHPLPIEGKGRTYVHDIKEGDKVKAGHIPTKTTSLNAWREEQANAKAWLEAMIMCDGCYQSNLVISTGPSEQSINEHIKECTEILKQKLTYNATFINYTPRIHEQNRHEKGHYYDVFLNTPKLTECKEMYTDLFNGVNKEDRLIPGYIFNDQPRHVMCAFLGGIIDADGGVSNKGYVQIGSTSKALAYQQFYLVDKLGYNPKIYLNHYNKKDPSKIRYRVEFASNPEIVDYIYSEYKKEKCSRHFPQPNNDDMLTVTSITKSDYDGPSYDMETETDRLDISGIQSHNCRTRVMGNEFDKTREITPGRGNLSFTSINLPRLGIEAHGDIDTFFKMLQDKLELVVGQLDERFNIQSHRKVKNMPFLMGQSVWIDSENLKPNDEIGEVLKHGSLSVGFIGLAECLVALTGKHHGESDEAQKLGLEIIGFMRKYLDKLSEERHLNYGLIGTPAEGLSGRFISIDKEKYGIIKGVTDREYYTNSFHIPVYFPISAFKKIELEAPYHNLTNAGHISYIELDGDPTKNLEAFETVIRCMKENGIGYGSINHPVDRDPNCGYNGIINDECPNCHRHETETEPFERIRRITGYLVGGMDRWNDAKKAEEHDRVKHGTTHTPIPLPQQNE